MTSLLASVLLAAASAAGSGAVQCTKELAAAAESAPELVESWGKMHEVFTGYGVCDDAGPGEAFSEAVTLMLSERWGRLNELQVLVKSDPAFLTFVLRHIDETVPV